jgi:hypothetical protein
MLRYIPAHALCNADILLDNETAPGTPAASKSVIWVDSTTKKGPLQTDDSGVVHGIISTNYNPSGTASLALGTTDQYIPNSNLLLPAYGMQVGAMFRWYINVTKTAAGVATPIFTIRIGSALSTGDTSRLVLTGAAQTAVLGGGTLIITVMVRTVSASGVIVGNFTVPAPSFGTGQTSTAVSSTFDNTGTIGGQSVGISVTTGTSAAWTIDGTRAELIQ